MVRNEVKTGVGDLEAKGFLGSPLHTAIGCDGKAGDDLAQIAQFNQSESILIDARRVAALFSRMGRRRAEAYVSVKVEKMTDLLARIEEQYHNDRHDVIASDSREISRLAADIGLTSLARVARDLGIVARRRDMAALGAIWARLVRIGDRSLEQVWEQPGLSM